MDHCPLVTFFNYVTLYVCALAYVYVWSSSHIEVKGQLVGISCISLSTMQVPGVDVRVAGLVASTFTPWAPSPAQVFSFSHGLLLGALSLVLRQKPSGERRKGWVAKYDLRPRRMRVVSWDFPGMCPTQSVLPTSSLWREDNTARYLPSSHHSWRGLMS